MATPDITPLIQTFIAEHIDSVEQLEVLLLLRNRSETNPEEAHGAEAISSELRSLPESVGRRLESLVAHGLVRRSQGCNPKTYRYQPRDADLAAKVGLLADIYRERRISVIQLIFSKPQVAFDALRSFANAFKLKGDDTQ